MKRWLLAFLAALAASCAHAQFTGVIGSGVFVPSGVTTFMSAPLMSGMLNANWSATSNAVNYMWWGNSFLSTSSTTQGLRAAPFPISGTLSNLYVNQADGAAQSAGSSYAIKICDITTSSCTLTCTIDGTPTTTCSDTTAAHNITVSSGDTVVLEAVAGAGTNTATKAEISYEFTSTVGQEAPIWWGNSGNFTGSTANQYIAIGQEQTVATTEAAAGAIMPSAGTIDKLYFNCGTNPGGVSKSWTATLMKNNVDTSLTATVTNTCTLQSDTNPAHAVTVAAGDVITMHITNAGTPSNGVLYGSLRWVPTTSNEYPLFANTGIWSNSANRFGTFGGNSTTGFSTDSCPTAGHSCNIWPVAGHVTRCAYATDTALTSTQTRTLNFRFGNGTQSNAGFTCAINSSSSANADGASGAYATGSGSTSVGSPGTGQYVNFESTPANTPAAITAWQRVGVTVTVP